MQQINIVFSFVRKCISERLVVKVCGVCSLLYTILHKNYWLSMHLRIIGILRLCNRKLTTIVRDIRGCVMLIQRGILIVDLDIDLVISNDFLNSKVVIIHAMIEMMFMYFYDFDIVDYSISNFKFIFISLATTSDNANHHDYEDDADYWSHYSSDDNTR